MPPLIVTDSTYEFVPPHEGNLWPRLLARVAARVRKKDHGVGDVEIRGAENLTQILNDGHGIVIAPNHCRMADALVLQALSQKLRQPFFVMASSHLFRGSRFMKWVLRRMGAFSVYREGVDRQAVEAAIDMIVAGQRPLVLFPEGALSQANDRLNALMEGVSFIARTAARKISKANATNNTERQVFVVPIAIRYLFQGDLKTTVCPILADIERRLSWRTNDDMPIVERIYKVGGALLGLKETEFIGQPNSGSIAQRLDKLIDAILTPMEDEWLNGRTDDSVINRVKELRKAIVPAMIEDDEDNEESPLTQPELDRRWRMLEDMELAQALSLFPEEYVASHQSVDRILETVERLAENLTGKAQAHPPMKAIIEVGQPFAVAAKRDRSAKTDPVLEQLECRLTAMLGDLSKESKMFK